MSGPVAGGSSGAGRIQFALAQIDVMVQGEGEVGEGASGWAGEAPADGLKPGPAFAFGTATLVSGTPPVHETLTWFEQVNVTG